VTTGPLNVDPEQVDSAGARWWALIPEDGAPPPAAGSTSLAGMSAEAVTAAGQAAVAGPQAQMGVTAGQTQGAAAGYSGQEMANTGSLTGVVTIQLHCSATQPNHL
jgi:hypothetical protein